MWPGLILLSDDDNGTIFNTFMLLSMCLSSDIYTSSFKKNSL